jgi:hypothetical protein
MELVRALYTPMPTANGSGLPPFSVLFSLKCRLYTWPSLVNPNTVGNISLQPHGGWGRHTHFYWLSSQSTYGGRVEIGGVYLPSQLERSPTTLYVMVDKVKGDGRAPPPSPDWANFVMMECTPESGNCHSVCTYSVIKLSPIGFM